jgi:exopolysaccharide biosynthesis operon protein EpsL
MYRLKNIKKYNIFHKPRQVVATLLYICSPSAFMFSLPAYAEDKDPVTLIAGISQQHDNNIFRESSLEHSDNITTAYVGLIFDKQYSQQRFKVDYTLTAYRYQNNDFLDFTANEYKTSWLWSLTPYLTGVLAAERSKQLNDFKDYRNFSVVNIRTNENQYFLADFSPHDVWHLLGGFSHSNQTNSQTFNEVTNSSLNSVDYGLKYDFRSNSTITLMGHNRKGSYDDRILSPATLDDTSFDEAEGETKLNWLVSGKSQINMRAGYVSREHDHFAQRDYSGVIGSLGYNWAPTGKLQVALAVSRDLQSYQTNDSSYTRSDTLSVSPQYAVSSKVTMRASASISERSFLGGGVVQSTNRVDTDKLIDIGVEWTPYRIVTVGGNLQRSSRSSSIPGWDFSDTTCGIKLNLSF